MNRGTKALVALVLLSPGVTRCAAPLSATSVAITCDWKETP